MTRSRRARAIAIFVAIAFVVAACSDDKKSPSATGSGGSGAESSDTSGGGAYKVDTSDCPSDVNDKITGTIKVGTTMPLSGGAAAAAFAPVAAGLKAYIAEA